MVLKRRLIHVLLVDQHRAGLAFDKVRNIAHAPGLPARLLGQLAQQRGDLRLVFVLKLHPDSKAHHKTSPGAFTPSMLLQTPAGLSSVHGLARWRSCRSSPPTPSRRTADNPAPASAA